MPMSRSIRNKPTSTFDLSTPYDSQRAVWELVCIRLWGADYGAALAEALGISDRTVRYWRAGRSRVNPDIVETLKRLDFYTLGLPEPLMKAIGRALRRLGRGETMEQLAERIHADESAFMFLTDRGRDLTAFPPFEPRQEDPVGGLPDPTQILVRPRSTQL
jgi:hypothetical protein